MWKPVGPENSIEAMHVVVAWQEPLGSLVMKRIFRGFDEKAYRAGLNVRLPVRDVDVVVGDQPASTAVRSREIGMQFQRTSLIKNPLGGVENKIVEQMVLAPDRFQYSTWVYDRWSTTQAKILELVSEAFDAGTAVSPLRSLRLEYIDRFVFEGDTADASPTGLISQNITFASKHIFSATDLWHSHAGVFEQHKGHRRLVQLNLDAVEISTPIHLAGRRSVGILTAVEDRFDEKTGLILDEIQPTFLPERLSGLHERVIRLFRDDVIDPAVKPLIGM